MCHLKAVTMIACTMQDMKMLDSVKHYLKVSLNNVVPIIT